MPFADLSTYTEESIPGYVGTMYGFSQDTRILNDPDDFHYFVPASNYVASYYDTSLTISTKTTSLPMWTPQTRTSSSSAATPAS